jgi:O-antigen/teichoic acid export membrane protein
MLSGTFQLTLSSVAVRLLSIATIPILTRLLSPQAYGAAAILGTVISLVSVFALAGVDMTYSRAYYSAEPPNGAQVEHYVWRFAIVTGVVTGLLSALGWWLVTRNSPDLDPSLGVILALGIMFSVVQTMTSTRARLLSRYRALALTNVLTGVIAAGSGIAIAAYWRQDAVALLIPVLLGYLVPVLALGTPSFSTVIAPSPLSRTEGITLLKIGFAGVVTAPMFWLLSSSDRWFLQRFHGAETVGIYSIGYSVAVIGMMVNTAVMSVWGPEASREYEQGPELARISLGRLMSRLIGAMALIWLVAASAGGDMVRWLANERFHGAADVVPFIAGGVFFYGAAQLAMYGLVLVKKLKWAAAWWFVGGFFCAACNFVLVPRFGGLGAAMTQTLSFAVIFAGILTVSQLKYRLELRWLRLLGAIALIAVAGAVMIPPWHPMPPLSILMKLPVGMVVALIVARVMADDWLQRGFRLIRQKTGR